MQHVTNNPFQKCSTCKHTFNTCFMAKQEEGIGELAVMNPFFSSSIFVAKNVGHNRSNITTRIKTSRERL